MFNEYQEYEPLSLNLLRFSKYKKFDEEKEGISCPMAIGKLQKEKNKTRIDKKYVIIFIIFEGKIIKIVKERLDKFSIDFFNPYMYDKKRLRVVVYLFDVQKDQTKFDQFLTELFTHKSLFRKTKHFVKQHPFSAASIISAAISGFILYYVYLSLVAYGIVPQHFLGIHEVTILIIITFLTLSIMVSLFYLFLPLLIILLFIYQIDVFFGFNMPVWGFVLCFVVLVSGLFVLLYWAKRHGPLAIRSLLNEITNMLPILSAIAGVIIFVVFIGLISIPVVFGIFKHDYSEHRGKSNYGMVMDIYQNMYSGYPKILIDQSDNNKTYYLPFEGKRHYFVYDVEKVKERYFRDLNKTKLKQTLCKKKQFQDEFRSMYIINNPYIKPVYQTQRFSIKDKNIIIEEFNMNKVLSYEDMNRSLCDSKMIRNR